VSAEPREPTYDLDCSALRCPRAATVTVRGKQFCPRHLDDLREMTRDAGIPLNVAEIEVIGR